MIRKSIIVVLTLAAVGTGGLWLLSYVVGAGNVVWLWQGEDPRSGLFVASGRLGIVLLIEYVDMSANALMFHHGFAGFEIARVGVTQDMSGTAWFAYLPLWFIFPILVAYPALAFICGPLRRWRRHRKGLCLNCGYNLTGNVSGVCSECSSVVMYRKRSRLRRATKWLGLILCLLIGIVWGVSLRWGGGNVAAHVTFALEPGAVVLAVHQWSDYRGWSWARTRRSYHWWPVLQTNSYTRNWFIPLWIPLLATGVPTFLLWRHDRRPPAGHCQRCGYNLRGLAEPRCPECGKAFDSKLLAAWAILDATDSARGEE